MRLTMNDDGQLLWYCQYCGVGHEVKQGNKVHFLHANGKATWGKYVEWKYCPFCGKSGDDDPQGQKKEAQR